MELDRRHGYLIQWLIGIGDMVVLNLMFLLVYHELDSFYTKAIDNNLREVLLLLNFCYFFWIRLSKGRFLSYRYWYSFSQLALFSWMSGMFWLLFWWFITSRPSLSFLVGVSLSGCCWSFTEEKDITSSVWSLSVPGKTGWNCIGRCGMISLQDSIF